MARDLGLDVGQRGSKFANAELALIHQQGKDAATRGIRKGIEYGLSIHAF